MEAGVTPGSFGDSMEAGCDSAPAFPLAWSGSCKFQPQRRLSPSAALGSPGQGAGTCGVRIIGRTRGRKEEQTDRFVNFSREYLEFHGKC